MATEPKRKKPGFMKVGVPGKPITGFKPVTPPTPTAGGASAPRTGLPSSKELLSSPGPGRPQSNVGKYLVRPTAGVRSGHEFVNDDVSTVEQVKQKYLSAYELPPALQPKYLRKPEVLDANRAKNISRGWNKPRSRQG